MKTAEQSSPPTKLAVAAYFYPAGGNLAYWDQLRQGHPQVAFAVATGLGLEGENPDGNYQEPAITMLNHGQILPECYAKVADIQMNVETSYEAYVKEWRPWGWEHRYPAKKFWHMVHGVDSEEKLQEVLALSKSRNAGYVFVTPKAPPVPRAPTVRSPRSRIGRRC